MRKAMLAAWAVLIMGGGLKAETYIYDFGTATGTYSTNNSASTTFLPAPPSGGGTARVRMSNNGGGSFVLANPGNPDLGAGSQLQITAPTGGSVNKFSIYDFAGATTAFSMQFTMSLSGNSGTFYFFAGDGSSFSDNSGFSSANIFTGMRFTLSATGIEVARRTGTTWSAASMITTGIVKDAPLTFTLFANNATSGSRSYDALGNSYSLAAGTWDLWLGDTRIISNVSKAALSENTVIDSFMFYGENSTGNVGILNLDNISYSSTLDAIVVVPEPHEYALMIGGLLGLLIVVRHVRRRRAEIAA